MYKRRWALFSICVLMFIISMFYRVSNAIIAPDIKHDLHLSTQDLGLLGAAFFYSFALVQFPLGLLLDRVGARITMVALNGLGIAGTIIFASSAQLSTAVAGRALLGLGMAANLMGTLKLFSLWFDIRRFATLSGMVLSLGTLGSLAATSPLALLVQALSWRGAFYVLALFHASASVLLFVIARDRPPPEYGDPPGKTVHPVPLSTADALKNLFTSWNYWAISMSAMLRYGALASIQALWAGPFLIEYLGLSPVTAGNLLLMISMGYIVGSPTGGILSDRILRSRKKVVILALFMSGAVTLLLALWESRSFMILLGAALFCLGFFQSFCLISYAHIRELMPERMSGTAMAGINFFTMTGAGIFIHGLGGVMEYMGRPAAENVGHYGTAFGICCMALFSAGMLYVTTRDSTVHL